MAKGTVVAKTGIKRKDGYLYYVDGSGNVRETKAKRGGTKGAKRCSAKSVSTALKKKRRAKAAPKKAARKTVKRKTAKRGKK